MFQKFLKVETIYEHVTPPVPPVRHDSILPSTLDSLLSFSPDYPRVSDKILETENKSHGTSF